MKLDVVGFLQKYKAALFISIGAIVLGVSLLFFLLIPQIIVLHSNDSVILKKRAQVNFLNDKANTLSSINQDTYKQGLSVALLALPQEKDIPEIIDQIQIILAKDRLQLNNIDFLSGQAGENQTSAASYQIKLDVTGDSDSLKQFINDLKNAPVIIKLTGLDIAASNGGLVQDTLTLTTYYQSPPTTLGSIDQAVNTLSQSDIDLIDTLQKNTQSTPLISSNASSGPRGKIDPFQ